MRMGVAKLVVLFFLFATNAPAKPILYVQANSPSPARILAVDLDTKTLLGTFADATGAAFVGPNAFTTAPDGTIYVAYRTGSSSLEIRRYSPTTYTFIDVFATSTSPPVRKLAFGADGNLYVGFATTGVRKLDATTAADVGFAGGSGGLEDFEFGPNGNLYAARPTGGSTRDVREFDPATGSLIGTLISNSQIVNVTDIAFGADGNLYLHEPGTFSIRRFDGSSGADLGVVTTLAGPIAFGPGDDLFIARNSSIQRRDPATGALIEEYITSAMVGGYASFGSMHFVLDSSAPPLTPEPTALSLFGLAFACLVWWTRHRCGTFG